MGFCFFSCKLCTRFPIFHILKKGGYWQGNRLNDRHSVKSNTLPQLLPGRMGWDNLQISEKTHPQPFQTFVPQFLQNKKNKSSDAQTFFLITINFFPFCHIFLRATITECASLRIAAGPLTLCNKDLLKAVRHSLRFFCLNLLVHLLYCLDRCYHFDSPQLAYRQVTYFSLKSLWYTAKILLL